MQPIAIPLGALLALVSSTQGPITGVPQAPGASQASRGPTPQVGPQDGGLQRVMPEGDPDEPGQDLFARQFDPQRWRVRLGASDLDRRERGYEALLQRAGFDPAARLFLEQLAKDPDAGELAWTARLALRELGRPRFGARGLPGGLLGGTSPLESMLQDFFARDDVFGVPGAFGLQGGPPGFGRLPALPGGGALMGRSFHLRQENGRTRLEVVERVDGQEQSTVYEGDSLDEILQQNPGLQDQLGGLRIQGGDGAPFGLDLELPRGLPGPELFGLERLPLAPQRPAEPVTTDKLGIIAQPLTAEHARELGLEEQGLFVERSAPGTYAYLLGIGVGDVLVELNGEPVRSVDDVGRIMAAHDPARPLRAAWIDELGQRRSRAWPPEAEAPRR